MICIHEFTVEYSAAWRTYKQAGHYVRCVYVCFCSTVCVGCCVQQWRSTIFVCCIQQSCMLHLSFCIYKGWCCYVCHVSPCYCSSWPVQVLLFSPQLCVTYLLQHLHTLYDSPHLTPLDTQTAPVEPSSLRSLHLHTTRHPSPSVTFHSPVQSHFIVPIHPHWRPPSHFPKRNNRVFFSNTFGSFFPHLSLCCFKPRVQPQTPYRSNLSCQSHLPLSLFLFLALKHTQTHTYLKFISVVIQMYHSNFESSHIHREKHKDA